MQTNLDIYAKEIQVQTIARKMISLSRQELISCMPYMDRALFTMPVEYYVDDGKHEERAIGFGTDGFQIYAVPSVVLDIYMTSRKNMNRLLFHTLLHCLFTHMYAYDRLDGEVWDISADMAVENVILELNLPQLSIEKDNLRREVLLRLFANTGKKNAESIYGYLMEHPEKKKEARKYAWLFKRDRHDLWRGEGKEEKISYQESKQKDEWEKMLRQVDQAAETYEKSRGLEPGSVTKHFQIHDRKKRSYHELLTAFVRYEEELQLDLDSFDYVYYTYGLQLYKNMPLIEPLEYKTDKKIKDFVIAIDTSGSCEGKLVEGFIRTTYDILKSTNVFREQMNVHIIQCDAAVQEEVKITSQAGFDDYMRHFTIKGMGGTDFRPVFARVEEELQEGEFSDLRGLIYFTDGRGTYPAHMPPFKTAMIFLEDERDVPDVPPWAVRMIVNEEDI